MIRASAVLLGMILQTIVCLAEPGVTITNALVYPAEKTVEYRDAAGRQRVYLVQESTNQLSATNSPILIYMHGAGGMEEQGMKLFPRLRHILNAKGWIFVCPRNNEYVGLRADLEKRYGKRKIFLSGASLGGKMTLTELVSDRGAYSGIILMCAAVSKEEIGGFTDDLPAVPIWIVCGEKDAAYVEGSRALDKFLRDKSRPVFYHEIPGGNHDDPCFKIDWDRAIEFMESGTAGRGETAKTGERQPMKPAGAQLSSTATEEEMRQMLENYIKEGEKEKALDLCSSLLDRYPNEDNCLRLIRLISDVKVGEEKVAAMDELLKTLPETVMRIRGEELVKQYRASGISPDVFASMERCIRDQAKDADIYHRCSSICERSSQMGKALEYAQKALELGDDRHRDYYTSEVARMLVNMKKYDEVDVIIDGMFARRQECIGNGATRLIVRTHRAKGDLDTYLAGLARKADADGTNKYFRMILASVYEAAGRYEDATKHYEQVLAVASSRQAYVGLMGVAKKAKKPDRLVDVLERLKRDFPDENKEGLVDYWLTDAYSAAGRHDDAIAAGQRALAVARDADHIRLKLGNAFRRKKDYQRAMEYFNRTLNDDDLRVETAQCVVLMLNEQGKLKEAEQFFEETKAKTKNEKLRRQLAVDVGKLIGKMPDEVQPVQRPVQPVDSGKPADVILE